MMNKKKMRLFTIGLIAISYISIQGANGTTYSCPQPSDITWKEEGVTKDGNPKWKGIIGNGWREMSIDFLPENKGTPSLRLGNDKNNPVTLRENKRGDHAYEIACLYWVESVAHTFEYTQRIIDEPSCEKNPNGISVYCE
jgi:hypothetical protein